MKTILLALALLLPAAVMMVQPAKAEYLRLVGDC